MSESDNQIYWYMAATDVAGATKVTYFSEDLAILYAQAEKANGLTTPDSEWYTEEWMIRNDTMEEIDAAYIAAVSPEVVLEILGRLMFLEERFRQVQHVLSPAWAKGKVMPAAIGYDDMYRIKELREVLKNAYPNPA